MQLAAGRWQEAGAVGAGGGGGAGGLPGRPAVQSPGAIVLLLLWAGLARRKDRLCRCHHPSKQPLQDFLFPFLIMRFFGIPHGKVDEFPSIQKKKKTKKPTTQQPRDKYVFNFQGELGSPGASQAGLEGKGPSLEEGMFFLFSLPLEVLSLFCPDREPCAADSGSPRCGWVPARPHGPLRAVS